MDKEILKIAVRKEDGTFDIEKTQEIMYTKVEEVLNAAHKNDLQIRHAVETILADAKSRVIKDTLIGLTLPLLGATIHNHTQIKDSLVEWIDANSGEGKFLSSKKGNGGGVCLSSRLKEFERK